MNATVVDSVEIQVSPRGSGGSMEAGSMDRRPWLGPLLLVGGCLAERERGSG